MARIEEGVESPPTLPSPVFFMPATKLGRLSCSFVVRSGNEKGKRRRCVNIGGGATGVCARIFISAEEMGKWE